MFGVVVLPGGRGETILSYEMHQSFLWLSKTGKVSAAASKSEEESSEPLPEKTTTQNKPTPTSFLIYEPPMKRHAIEGGQTRRRKNKKERKKKTDEAWTMVPSYLIPHVNLRLVYLRKKKCRIFDVQHDVHQPCRYVKASGKRER